MPKKTVNADVLHMSHDFSPEYLQRHFPYGDTWLDPENVSGTDATSYRVLNHAWSIDRNRAYFNGQPLKRADRASFRVLNENFARDATRLFCAGGSPDAIKDPATFQVLDEGWYEPGGYVKYVGYSRDQQHVYFGARPRILRGAQPASFEVLPHLHARDANRVYHEDKQVEGADPRSFRVLSRLYAKDDVQVFYGGELVRAADPGTFQLIDEFLARDAHRVFDRGRCVEGANPDSFAEVDESSIYLDRAHVYVGHKKLAHVDRESFEHLGHGYFADRNGVYWLGKVIRGAHRKSFVVDGFSEAHDGAHQYRENERWAAPRQWRLPAFLRIPWWILLTIVRRSRDEPAPSATPRPAQNLRTADLRVLATVLANGEQHALDPVLLAIQDSQAFRERHTPVEQFADEPPYQYMLDVLGDDDLHAYDVLEATYKHFDLLGSIDWRSESEETIALMEPMLRRFGIDQFDWSFIDVLIRHGDGTEMRNNNFLTILQDRLRTFGLALVHVDQLGDSYGFAVIRETEYSNIAGFEVEGRCQIKLDFGPDEAYGRAKRILSQHLPTSA